MEKTPSPEITPEMLQQHPELMAAMIGLFLLFILFVAGGLGSWIFFAMRVRGGKQVLPMEPWWPRSWGLLDMLVIVCSIFLGQSLFAVLGVQWWGIDIAAVRQGDAELPLSIALMASLGNVAAMVIGVVWIMFRYGVSLGHVGFEFKRLPYQALLGLVVGLATLPVVYALMMLVSLGFSTEYTHPLIEEMSTQGTLLAFLMGAVTAALIAPLTEEFLFRVIIQGWLQSLPFKSLMTNLLGGRLVSRGVPAFATHGLVGDGVPLTNVAAGQNVAPEFAALPTTVAVGDTAALHAAAATEAELVPPIWPSVVTGILFGLAHWGYGLSFIPLIVLGIVLGLVYRATHSIWPCILIHAMLNGTSMLALGATILIQRATGSS